MAEVAPVPAAASPTKVLAKQRRRRTGPTVSELIVSAVSDSRERKGMSLAALKKALAAQGYDVNRNKARIRISVKSLVAKGWLLRTRGKGASGSFKVDRKALAKRARRPARRRRRAAGRKRRRVGRRRRRRVARPKRRAAGRRRMRRRAAAPKRRRSVRRRTRAVRRTRRVRRRSAPRRVRRRTVRRRSRVRRR